MLGLKLTVVVLDNRCSACIDWPQRSKGAAPFNNLLADSRHETMPQIDFAAHAASLGAASEKVDDIAGLTAAMARAKASARTYVIVHRQLIRPSRTEAGGALVGCRCSGSVRKIQAVGAARAANTKFTSEARETDHERSLRRQPDRLGQRRHARAGRRTHRSRPSWPMPRTSASTASNWAASFRAIRRC